MRFNVQQIKKSSELEALRLSLTDTHMSQIEHSKESLEQEHQSALAKVQNSLEDKFNQESAVMQARYQSEMDRNEEQQQKVQELHKQMTSTDFFSFALSVFFFFFLHK